jgi:hypothetical protein
MDPNTELLLAKAAQPLRWEDEEKATNDVEELREEFRRRHLRQRRGPGGERLDRRWDAVAPKQQAGDSQV